MIHRAGGMDGLELWFVAGTAEGAGEGREQGRSVMRIRFIARRAAALAVVATAALAPAAAQADVLANWGDSSTRLARGARHRRRRRTATSTSPIR